MDSQSLASQSLASVFLWNFMNDRRLYNKGLRISKSFPECSNEVRNRKLIDFLTSASFPERTIIGVMELMEESCTLIQNILISMGFSCESIPYNMSNGAFCFLIATKGIYPEKITSFPLTETGEYVKNEERGSLPKSFTLGDNFDKTLVEVTFSAFKLYTTHIGLSNEARTLQMEKISEIIFRETSGGTIPFVFGGDLNAFDARVPTPTLLVSMFDSLVSKFDTINWISRNWGTTFKAYLFDLAFKMSKQERDLYFALIDLSKEGEIDREFLSSLGTFSSYEEALRFLCEIVAQREGIYSTALDHFFVHGLNASAEPFFLPWSLSDHAVIVAELFI